MGDLDCALLGKQLGIEQDKSNEKEKVFHAFAEDCGRVDWSNIDINYQQPAVYRSDLRSGEVK